MAKLVFLQVLLLTAKVCSGNGERPLTTGITHGVLAEASIAEANELNGRNQEDFDYFGGHNEADAGIDFEYESEVEPEVPGKHSALYKEHLMKEAMLKAMKKPAIREQIGEVIPILRAMSPTQRLTLAALVSSQILSQGRLNEADLIDMASMLAGNNVDDVNDRQNITEHLLLPISVDIAKIFKGLGKDVGRSLRSNAPNSIKLRKRPHTNQNLRRRQHSNRRMDSFSRDGIEGVNPMQKKNATAELQNLVREGILQPSVNDCEYFSSSFCLEVSDYPSDAIIRSVEKHRGVMDTLLEDFRIQSPEAYRESPRIRRRQDVGYNEIKESQKKNNEFMCPSSVRYARPKRARTTSGKWKYVVNAGDYTQTLRLEMCLKPLAPCSYVTNNFNSQCTQVYNYHRLLTWEENKGLHMDIFKVPSCCSCHIQGYSSYYPPVKDFTFADKRKEPTPARPAFESEPFDVHMFANAGNKREVRPIPLLTSPNGHGGFQPKEPPSKPGERLTPLHYLVPRGPPLPLEGESVQFLSESHFSKKRGSESHRRAVEVSQHKGDDAGESGDERKHVTRSKYPNGVFGNGKGQAPLSRKPAFAHPPGGFAAAKPSTENPLFVTPRAEPDVARTRLKGFEPEGSESKLSANVATTLAPHGGTSGSPQSGSKTTSAGRKKVNYDYHPIIEFFKQDTVNRTVQQYSKPLNPVITSQDWRPLVKRNPVL